MSAKVVDASAVLSVLLDAPEAADVAPRLDSHELFAPVLIVFEVVNVRWKKARLYPQKRNALRDALFEFRRMDIDLRDIDPEEVFDLAVRHKLTGYDASYLWLARELNAELVTLDKELIAAAKLTA